MQWFKFYGQDYLCDPKILALSASERSCWITLLSYASVNDNGMITFLSEEQLMTQAGIGIHSEEWDETKGILKKFEKLGMITLDNANDNANNNEVITIKNWQNRQEIKLTAYERVKRCRAKKRNNDNTMITLDNANDNAMITTEKKREEKNREEKNRKEKNREEERREEGFGGKPPTAPLSSPKNFGNANADNGKRAAAQTARGKPYYWDCEMRQAQGKWWVIPQDGGKWLEFSGKEEEIEWRNKKL